MKVHTQLTKNENRKWTNMKLQSIVGIVFSLMLVVASSAYAKPSAGVLFQSGLYQEEVKGDLDAAIKVYERIIINFPKDRPVVAKTLLHIGLCYEKLGKQEAQKTYRHLIQEYADQHEPVAQARKRLAELGQPPSGMVVRRVWADCPLFNMFRGISPDGRYISHADLESGDLAIHELATGQNRVLTNEGSEWQEFTVEHIFSPDGQKLAFNWYRKDASLELRIIGLDGSKPRTLYHNPEVGYLAPRDWSPDGRQILAILGRKDAGVEIALISVADGSVRALKTALSEVGGLRFSPDGRYIVYESPSQQDSSKSDIFVLASDASREMALVEHPANDSVLGWSPDGRHILFSSDRRGATDAWLIPVSDGKADGPPELLIPNIGPIEPMGFTRDGAFYYHTQTALKDVYTAEVDLKGGKILSRPKSVSEGAGGLNMAPAWSPDGRYLAYLSRRDPHAHYLEKVVSIYSVETGEQRHVDPGLKIRASSGFQWFRDGRAVAVVGRKKGEKFGLYRVDVQTGEAQAIVRLGATLGLAIAPDGKAIFYTRFEEGGFKRRLMKQDLQSGQEEELYRFGGHFSLALSPDGQHLAFWEGNSLKTIPASGGQPREIVQLPDGEGGPPAIEWTHDAKYLLFVKQVKKSKPQLWKVSVEDGQSQNLGSAPGLGQLRLHPDGRWIAFTAGRTKRDLWVMENFLPESKTGE